MQPSTFYKVSHLSDAKREAMTWLANQLSWERTLDRLRSTEVQATRQAA